jgi:hypothetical protein
MTTTMRGYQEYAGGLEDFGGLTKMNLRIIFLERGLLVDDKFLDDWIRLSSQGRTGTSADLRKGFCGANHYEIQLPSKKWARVVEIWGLAIPYMIKAGKPRLFRVLSKSWLLQQTGRSVQPPALCKAKP